MLLRLIPGFILFAGVAALNVEYPWQGEGLFANLMQVVIGGLLGGFLIAGLGFLLGRRRKK